MSGEKKKRDIAYVPMRDHAEYISFVNRIKKSVDAAPESFEKLPEDFKGEKPSCFYSMNKEQPGRKTILPAVRAIVETHPNLRIPAE